MQFEEHKQNNMRRILITMSIILRNVTKKCAVYVGPSPFVRINTYTLLLPWHFVG